MRLANNLAKRSLKGEAVKKIRMKRQNRGLKNLITTREKLYEKIKRILTPLILESIKSEERIHGYKRYWELYNELSTIDLKMTDYERLINDLQEKKLVTSRWSAGLGGYLKTRG